MPQSRLHFLRIGNIACVIATMAVHTLANLLPINGHKTVDLFDLHPNLVSPIGLTFLIWGPIYLLMFVYAVKQYGRLFRPEGDSVTETIGGWFMLSCLANMSWIFAWHFEQVLLSLVATGLAFAAVLTMYIRLGVGRPDATRRHGLTLNLFLSVYLGGISVALISNVTLWLVSIGWDRIGQSEVFWAIGVVGFGASLALFMLFYRLDVVFALVLIWALSGTVLKQVATSDPSAALIGTLVVSLAVIEVAVLVALWHKWTRFPVKEN